jgi:hypothetical protein
MAHCSNNDIDFPGVMAYFLPEKQEKNKAQKTNNNDLNSKSQTMGV